MTLQDLTSVKKSEFSCQANYFPENRKKGKKGKGNEKKANIKKTFTVLSAH